MAGERAADHRSTGADGNGAAQAARTERAAPLYQAQVAGPPSERSDAVARDGLRIFDADTHVGPSMDVIERYLSAAERAALEPLRDRRTTRSSGQVTYQGGERKYERRLGESASRTADPRAYMGASSGAHQGPDPHPPVDHDPTPPLVA